MKADWLGWVIRSASRVTLLAYPLARIRKITLMTVIGRNWRMSVAPGTLGMREMVPKLRRPRSIDPTKNSSKMAMTSGLITFQKVWKKMTGRPSGPGAEEEFIPLMASQTSCSEKGAVRDAFSASETSWAPAQQSGAREMPLRGAREKRKR